MFKAIGNKLSNKYLLTLLLSIIAGLIISAKGITFAFILIVLPFIFIGFLALLRFPKAGIYFALIMGFILPILSRYLPISFPFGVTVDAMLVITYLMYFIKHWQKTDFSLAKNDITLLLLIWMGYIILQIANPQAHSIAAWFYVMRSIALYQVLLIPLCFVLFNNYDDCKNFFKVVFGFSLLGIFWAIKQKYLGVDSREQAWLDAGGAVTHILFGKLRVFSYYFDAGTFGAAMGQICIMAIILFLGPYNYKKKAFFLILSGLSFYALMLSGTRGALAVPGLGAILYILLTKNFKVFFLGGFVILFGFVFLKYTTIGNSNYDINRLRTAVSFDDPSLNIRLINRAKLTEYLKDKPFGGGLGTTGSWGRQFSPGTWLSEFEPDGLYTSVRAETGLIGRIFYVGMWIYILIRGVIICWQIKDKKRQNIIMAILCGFAGILLANYGNSVLTQFPISLTTYIAISFVFSIHKWDEDGNVIHPKKKSSTL